MLMFQLPVVDQFGLYFTGNRKLQLAKSCPPTNENDCFDRNHLAPSCVRQSMSHPSEAHATDDSNIAATNHVANTKASLDISVPTPSSSNAVGNPSIQQQEGLQNGVEMEGDSNIDKV